jgi:hypothetical protein
VSYTCTSNVVNIYVFLYRYDERGSLGGDSDDENREQEEDFGLIAAETKENTENNEQVNDNLKQEGKEPNAINNN